MFADAYLSTRRTRGTKHWPKWNPAQIPLYKNIESSRGESNNCIGSFFECYHAQLYSTAHNHTRRIFPLAPLLLSEGTGRSSERQHSLTSFQGVECGDHLQQLWKAHNILGRILTRSCPPFVTGKTSKVLTDLGLLACRGRWKGII